MIDITQKNLTQPPPDKEALNAELVHDQEGLHGWVERLVLGGVIVRGDGAANGHPAIHVHQAHDGPADLAAHVVEITVNTVGSRPLQGGPQVAPLVVDSLVKAKLLLQPGTLLIRASYSNCPAP